MVGNVWNMLYVIGSERGKWRENSNRLLIVAEFFKVKEENQLN